MKISSIYAVFLCLFCLSSVKSASPPYEEDCNWIRYPAISPDGEQIAFSFKGDIWIVDSGGGTAKRVTQNQGYERTPVWSPDSQMLAFAADWHGNFDVFVKALDQSEAKRLTWHSTGGVPHRLDYHLPGDIPTCFSRDGKAVWFASRRHDAHDAIVGNDSFGELYSVSLQGGRPRQLMTIQANSASENPVNNGLILFHDYKGYEDAFRKHQIASSTRDIWVYRTNKRQFERLTGFNGNDTEPVWSADGNSVYFLSEQKQSHGPQERDTSLDGVPSEPPMPPRISSSQNIWKLSLDRPEEQIQITHHDVHPVRFLSVSKDETLCYLFKGNVYLRGKDQSQSSRVAINFAPDSVKADPEVIRPTTGGISEFLPSPCGTKIAFIVQGDVFVRQLDEETTTRITNTAAAERDLSWSTDSRYLFYATERENSWDIYRSTLVESEGKGIQESPLIATQDEEYGGKLSPDGKLFAFVRNHHEIAVRDIGSGSTKTLVPAELNFSDQLGAISVNWSRDSSWLTFNYLPIPSGVPEVGIANVNSEEIFNLSQSGYADRATFFSAKGDAVLYQTDRYGMKNHGGFGGQNDLVVCFLNRGSLSDFERKRQPHTELLKSNAESVKFHKEDIQWRKKRLTSFSTTISSAATSPTNGELLYCCLVGDEWRLKRRSWSVDDPEDVLKLDAPCRIRFSNNGQPFILKQGSMYQLDMNRREDSQTSQQARNAKMTPIEFSVATANRSASTRSYIFERALRQISDRFYDANLHGVDWHALATFYREFLPSINNGYDFSDLIAEMVGELNASHMGCHYQPDIPKAEQTMALGLIFDQEFNGDALLIANIVKGGPCWLSDQKITEGVQVTHIDGVKLSQRVNHWRLLRRDKRETVELGLFNPRKHERWKARVHPISINDENKLLYEQSVEGSRNFVLETSENRIGYVHIQWMSDDGFRRLFSESLGEHYDKEALILDTRFNGGGWLHDDLLAFFQGSNYNSFKHRNRAAGSLGRDPLKRWHKPVVILQNECNYSNGHFAPWCFKENGIGMLVGSEVPGTSTTVWWEKQIDPAISFGVPQIGFVAKDGYYLENASLKPDVFVVNGPQEMSDGIDAQLAKAVEAALESIRFEN